MNQKLRTALSFAKNVLTTGALSETSRKVEIEICKHLSIDKDLTIIEFGMGHGNITKEILANISQKSQVYAFEINPDFCEFVESNVKDPRLKVINDGAENVKNYITSNVDFVLASIPFSFFSKEKAFKILNDSHEILNIQGMYSQVLYTKHNFKKFQKVFEDCTIKKLSYFPPEYIYHCQKLK